MSKYTALDAKILQAIARGDDTFTSINGRCRDLSWELATGTDAEPFCIVDRRLQALRKAGKIVFSQGQWAIKQKVEI